MKKPKYSFSKENPKQKSKDQSPDLDYKKRILYNSKLPKKERTITTKANTTMTESSKEDKKEKKDTIFRKKTIKETNKLNKSTISINIKEKKRNKTIEINHLSKKRKKIKKHRNSTKIKNSLSQRHFMNLRASKSFQINLTKSMIDNNAESSNNIMQGEADNFVKSLLNNYMDGTDNIINEDSEAFINIKNNVHNDDLSLFGDENENTETNTFRETLDLNNKKDSSNLDNNNNTNANINIAKSYNFKGINYNLNSTKNNKKEKKVMIKITNSENNKIKSNLSSKFIHSPKRSKEHNLSISSNNKSNQSISNISYRKKTFSNLSNKIKSFTKSKKEDESINTNNEKNKDNLKRKMIYSSKLINSMNKLKQSQKANTEIDYTNKKDIIPIITTNINLDVIFEKNKVVHHYLENTVSAKNKMVQKRANNEQNKNNLSLFHKQESNTISINLNDNTIKNSCNNANISDKILRLNKTPRVKKEIKERFSLNYNRNTNQIKNYNGRKYSQHVKGEFSLDNNNQNKNLINSKIFQKKLDDYLITRELGKGSYAVVKLAVDKKTKNKYAIKIYSKQCLIDPQLRNTVKNEINILRQIDNENIMKLYEVIDTQSNLYLVQEYINGINLLEIIKNEKHHFIKESRAKKIFLKIVSGIEYCHRINIFHRDIKLENILVLKDDSVKIIDFGFGIICKSDAYQKLFCGTKSYMPPEIVKKEKYIASYSDIWSLGVLFYAMLFGIFPFKGKDDEELFVKIKEAKITFPEYNPISDKTKELFGKIFVVNPNERISLDGIADYLKEEK